MIPQSLKHIPNQVVSVALLTIGLLMLFSVPAIAQDKSAVPEKLTVGVMHFPPFAMQKPSGEWKGLGIELLQLAARELGTALELQEYSNVRRLKDAAAHSAVDLTPAAMVSEDLERILDFSNPYFHSGSAIATPLDGQGFGLFHVFRLLFSTTFLKVVGMLVLLWMIAGSVVWLFERKRDEEMFGERILHGLGHGIWWAAVTMTTVGYGDKAPKTVGGRCVAIVWMFASIILIASFTATITTSMTVGELKGKVRSFSDLSTVRVGSLVDSEHFGYLTKEGITAIPFMRIEDGLQAVAESRIDAFVHDEAILKYLTRTGYATRVQVLPETFNDYYIAMVMVPGSTLREPLNRALLGVIKKDEWRRILKKYFGPGI